jgi:hypothetical protein
MKNLLIMISLAALAGCVVAPPAPYYATRAPEQRFDPYQWHTVPSQPSRVEYTSEPVYTQEPVYASRPVYAAQPVYAPQPYYYFDPAITFGLGLIIGNSWRGGRGHHGRRHR